MCFLLMFNPLSLGLSQKVVLKCICTPFYLMSARHTLLLLQKKAGFNLKIFFLSFVNVQMPDSSQT